MSSNHKRNKSAHASNLSGVEKIEKQMIRALNLNKITVMDRGQLVNQIDQRPKKENQNQPELKVEKVLALYLERKLESDKLKLTQNKKKTENQIISELRKKRIERMLSSERDKKNSSSPLASYKITEKIQESKPEISNVDKKVKLKKLTKKKDFINGILNKSEMINSHEKALIWYKSYLGKNL